MSDPTLLAGTNVRMCKASEHNPGGLPTGYWLEAVLKEDLTVGHPIVARRHRRARQTPEEPAVVDCPGIFTSSPVRKLAPQADGSITAMTENSFWQIARIE